MRRSLLLLGLVVAASCGLKIAVALIPEAGSAAPRHGASQRQGPAATDPACTDGSCDTIPYDSCGYDDPCYDTTTPYDSCGYDDSCYDTTGDTTPAGATPPAHRAQTIAVVLRRGSYDAGWIPMPARGSVRATLTQAAARGARARRTGHHRRRGRALVVARGRAASRSAGRVHLFLRLTGRGRRVLRTASGSLTLTTTIRLNGARAKASTATPLVLAS